MLTPSEGIEDFKEVTASEKANIEASDAKWERPSEELIANWDEAWFIGGRHYGKYNRESGFFEGNEEVANHHRAGKGNTPYRKDKHQYGFRQAIYIYEPNVANLAAFDRRYAM